MRTSLKLFVGLSVALLLALWRIEPMRSLVSGTDEVATQEGVFPHDEEASQAGPTSAPSGVQLQLIPLRYAVNETGMFQGNASTEAPAFLPLVFQDVPFDSLRLNEQQLQVFEDLQKRFVEEIGGLNQDPNDPVYAEKWQSAQPANDDLLQALLGGEFFLNYELEAERAR